MPNQCDEKVYEGGGNWTEKFKSECRSLCRAVDATESGRDHRKTPPNPGYSRHTPRVNTTTMNLSSYFSSLTEIITLHADAPEEKVTETESQKDVATEAEAEAKAEEEEEPEDVRRS